MILKDMDTFAYNVKKTMILLAGLLAGGIVIEGLGHGMGSSPLVQAGHGMIMTACASLFLKRTSIS